MIYLCLVRIQVVVKGRGLLVAYVYRGRLFPHGVAKTCWAAFQNKMDPKGYNWKAVSNELKEIYFQEFKKQYTVPANHEVIIKKCWMKMAKRRYSDMISRVVKKRQNSRRPQFITEADWPGWLLYWADTKVEHNANVNTKNRRTEVDGVGTGMSKHSCGSKPALSHLMDMTKANGGVEPPLYEFERKIHMSKKTNDWVDQKAERLYEEVHSQVETMNQQLANSQGETEGGESGGEIERGSRTVTKKIADKLYVEAAGGIKKRRIYGVGGVGDSIVRDSESVAYEDISSSTIKQIVSQRMEVERAEMNDKLKVSSERQASLEEQLKETKEQMEQQNNQLESQSNQLQSQGQQIVEVNALVKKITESMNH